MALSSALAAGQGCEMSAGGFGIFGEEAVSDRGRIHTQNLVSSSCEVNSSKSIIYLGDLAFSFLSPLLAILGSLYSTSLFSGGGKDR